MKRNDRDILIINLGGIGDFILSTPALRALRASYDEARIFLLGTPQMIPVARMYPYIDDFFCLEHGYARRFSPGAWLKNIRTLEELQKRHFDLALNMRTLVSSRGAWKIRFLLSVIHPRKTAGRDTEGRGGFFDIRIPETDRGQKYERDYDVELVRELDVPVEDLSVEVPVDPAGAESLSRKLADRGAGPGACLIGLHPGGMPSRRWPVENFARVIRSLSDAVDCRFVITGGKAEALLAQELVKLSERPVLNFAGALSLGETMALIRQCRLYITNDTGPMHIAAGLQVPMVAIFGPGDLVRYDPMKLNPHARIVYKQVGCAELCNKYICDKMICLKSIEPELVLEAARDLLDLK